MSHSVAPTMSSKDVLSGLHRSGKHVANVPPCVLQVPSGYATGSQQLVVTETFAARLFRCTEPI